MRVHLLQNLKDYAEHLSAALINDKIFPCIVTGFSDTLPLLRELTVKSMVLIVSKLSPTLIETKLLKHLAALQTDTEAAIRTNTTYCIAKIAPHLTEKTRAKVLIPGFGKALRDPFPPARMAALVSIGVTLPYYSPADCASKVK